MKRKALLAVIICALVAGTSGVFIKTMTSISGASLTWIRTGVPALLLLLVLKSRNKSLFKNTNKNLWIASGLNALRMYLYIIAYLYTSIGNAVIIMYSWPIFVAIMSNVKLKESFNKRQWLYLFLAFFGLVLAYSDKSFSFENKDVLGMIAALASAFFYAITVIIFKKETEQYSSLEIIFYQNFIGLIVFAPFFIIGFPTMEIPHIGIGVIYAITIGLGVFSLFFFGLKYLQASVASSIMYLEIVSAIMFSYFFYGEALSVNMILGGACIVLSSFMIGRSVE